MNSIINYLIEVNLGLVFLYCIYGILLKNETAFQVKRFYLLASILFSLLFPLISISVDRNSIIPSLSNSIPTYWLPEIVITADGTSITQPAPFAYWTWVTAIYLGVAILLVLLLSVRIGTMIRLFQKSRHYVWKKYTIAESEKVTGVFSFFQFIFLPPAKALDAEERQEILQHEEIHIQQFHSFDILLIHFLEIICWFNPIIKAYKVSLVQVHEFEADARSVEGKDVNRYCSLLAKVALQQNGYVLANHFTNSFTLKRITMMKTVRKKISQWKIATTLFTTILVFVVVACQDQILNELSDSTLTQVADFPEVVQRDIDTKYKAKYPGAQFNYMEGDADEIREKFAANTQVKQILLNTYTFPDRDIVGVLTVPVANLELKDENDVYSVVEESAEPLGGMTVFYEFVASNISYPSEARTKGVEGRVFIEFVVNEDGSLSDIRPIKGIGAGCDEEAVRIMKLAKPWKPGKQRGVPVKQRMVIPIIYRLDNSSQPVGELHEIKKSMRVSGDRIQENGKYFMVGQVKNSDGNPLPGMNIVVAGTTRGTVSDLKGNFKLEIPNENGTLVFSFVGYNTESLAF